MVSRSVVAATVNLHQNIELSCFPILSSQNLWGWGLSICFNKLSRWLQLRYSRRIRHYFANKSLSSQSCSFSSSHAWMWESDYKESWAQKNWWFWTVVLEKTLEEIQPVDPKGSQSWIFIGRTDAEASIFWPPDVKNWLIWKDPDAGKDWRQEEKWTTEDEMVGWHHRLNGHEFE